MTLDDLPALQFHGYQPWLADVCGYCGGEPAAHAPLAAPKAV